MESDTVKKKQMIMIGIAGTPQDFLLSLPLLKCSVYKNENIKKNINIDLKCYYYIPSEDVEKRSKEIIAEIEGLNPDILGFSCYVWNIDCVKIICTKLKQKMPNIKIIWGGPEISKSDIISGKFNNCSTDFIVFGEGEKPLSSLLEHFLGFQKLELNNIKGLAYKDKNIFICNNEADYIENITNEPSPYLHNYCDEMLEKEGIRINIETQRGCNFRCAYCCYHKNFPKIRYRSADTVIEEIDYAYKRGVKMGRIVDANFLSNRDFAKKIIQGLIERDIKMSFFFELLPLFLDEEVARLIGTYIRISPENRITVGMGIQTLNKDSLAAIRRQMPVECFENAFQLLQRENVIIKSDIILGLPHETKETYLKTLEFITEKMVHGTNCLSLALLRILPGSDLVEIAKREKIIIDKKDGNHFIYETSTLKRQELIDCLRLNSAAVRLLSSMDDKERLEIRKAYFAAKDRLGITNIELLQYFVNAFFEFLKDKKSSYIDPDFPDAEDYYCKQIFLDVPNDWLLKKMHSLRSEVDLR